MKKIYIAGPDVFEKNSIEIGKNYVALCEKYGFIGMYPLDNVINFNQKKEQIATDIFKANEKLIDACDIVIANLNYFRGKEPDSGTVWECGYAYAKGKKVYGYINSKKPYIDNFDLNEKTEINGMYRDVNDCFIEDFDAPLNLMISCSVKEIIEGSFEDALKRVSE